MAQPAPLSPIHLKQYISLELNKHVNYATLTNVSASFQP